MQVPVYRPRTEGCLSRQQLSPANINLFLLSRRSLPYPELPGEFRALNQSLNYPVDIRIDVQYDEMAELTAKAGVYLHTFGFIQSFGKTVSIAEALACGATVLARDCTEARVYAGPDSFYYSTAEDAAAILRSMTRLG